LTIFYAVLSLEEDELRYSSGGQFPYPVVITEDGTTALTDHDQPVGLFEESVYTEHKVKLNDVAGLLMMSDGILELFPQDSTRARMEWLSEEISLHGSTIDALVGRFEIESRSELPDDVAFLSITR